MGDGEGAELEWIENYWCCKSQSSLLQTALNPANIPLGFLKDVPRFRRHNIKLPCISENRLIESKCHPNKERFRMTLGITLVFPYILARPLTQTPTPSTSTPFLYCRLRGCQTLRLHCRMVGQLAKWTRFRRKWPRSTWDIIPAVAWRVWVNLRETTE
jgi:hypothetical protein